LDGLAWSLLSATAVIAVVHCALGPDHYLPFIVLARARGWSTSRTTLVTATCGLAHVLSSLALAGLGVLLGLTVASVERWEHGRGGAAAWLLVGLGLAYGMWGLRHGLRRRGGWTLHTHAGDAHVHRRGHEPHRHSNPASGSRATFWTLLAVFIVGPCEPLVPVFMLPASRGRWGLALLAAMLFGAITVCAMVALTLLGRAGLRSIRIDALEPWSHSIAGAAIAVSGLTVLLLEW
jgi:hypothetical protein